MELWQRATVDDLMALVSAQKIEPYAIAGRGVSTAVEDYPLLHAFGLDPANPLDHILGRLLERMLEPGTRQVTMAIEGQRFRVRALRQDAATGKTQWQLLLDALPEHWERFLIAIGQFAGMIENGRFKRGGIGHLRYRGRRYDLTVALSDMATLTVTIVRAQ